MNKPVAKVIARGDSSTTIACIDNTNLKKGNFLYAAPQPAPAAQDEPVAQPLADADVLMMWRASKWRGNGGQADWFSAGFRAAERAHGIGGKP